MNNTLKHIAVDLMAAIVSGILLCAAFPSYDLAALVWIGLVPLLVAVAGANPFRAFILAFAAGAVFFLGLFDWVRVVPEYKPLHHFLWAIFLGSYFAFFGLFTSIVARRLGVWAALWAAPFIWICLEFLRFHLGWLSVPWGLLGHSLHASIGLLQLASITGVYGLSFLIVLVNAAIAGLLYTRMPSIFKPRSNPINYSPHRKFVPLFAASLCCLIFTSIYGWAVLARPVEGRPIKLALVQGNIAQTVKWDPVHAPAIMKVYTDLTRKAAESSPDLIVWPESATPRSIMADRAVMEQVRKIVEASGTHMLIGSSSLQKFNLKNAKRTKFGNSAFLVFPGAGMRLDNRYDKIRLLPFGEYVPYQKKFPWSSIGVPIVDTYNAGRDYTVLTLSGARFSVPICWENLFPTMIRQFARNGAQFIVNITNEAWFGETAAPYQFLAMNVFRAVENGLFVVRCANTGVSCIIDRNGRITDRLEDARGKDIFIPGVLTGEIVASDANTIYSRYGDWFAWCCIIVAAILVMISLKPKKNTA